jgi:hypothetical protein
MKKVRTTALGAMIGQVVKGMIAYSNGLGRCAIARAQPEECSFGMKIDCRYEVTDDAFTSLGNFRGIGNLDLSYRKYVNLSYENGKMGLDILMI